MKYTPPVRSITITGAAPVNPTLLSSLLYHQFGDCTSTTELTPYQWDQCHVRWVDALCDMSQRANAIFHVHGVGGGAHQITMQTQQIDVSVLDRLLNTHYDPTPSPRCISALPVLLSLTPFLHSVALRPVVDRITIGPGVHTYRIYAEEGGLLPSEILGACLDAWYGVSASVVLTRDKVLEDLPLHHCHAYSRKISSGREPLLTTTKVFALDPQGVLHDV